MRDEKDSADEPTYRPVPVFVGRQRFSFWAAILFVGLLFLVLSQEDSLPTCIWVFLVSWGLLCIGFGWAGYKPQGSRDRYPHRQFAHVLALQLGKEVLAGTVLLLAAFTLSEHFEFMQIITGAIAVLGVIVIGGVLPVRRSKSDQGDPADGGESAEV